MSVIAITTRRRCSEKDVERAHRLAKQWDLIYVSREKQSLETVAKRAKAQVSSATGKRVDVIVVNKDELVLHLVSEDLVFRYHPGMALNRLRRLIAGEEDWMVRAMDISPGDRVLDATLGLGSDALVASYVVGDEGKVVGIESEKALALIVSTGMKTYTHAKLQEVNDSLRRIDVVNTDSSTYIDACEDKSFDVVYFDPMFDVSVEESTHMRPIRHVANTSPLSRQTFDNAMRVARKRVVVKDRIGGPYATSGWFDDFSRGRRTRIEYCIAHAK